MTVVPAALGPPGGREARLVLAAVGGAFAGALAGRRLVPRVTMGAVQTLTGLFLLGIGAALAAGLA
jgi:hypothetical protein